MFLTRRTLAPLLRLAGAALAAVTVLAAPLRAADLPGSADHPLVSRFKGAVIRDYITSKYDSTQLPDQVANGRDITDADVLKLEGKITYINYQLPDGVAPLEAVANYESALSAHGFQVLLKCKDDFSACGRAGFGSFVVNSGKAMKTSHVNGRSVQYFGMDNEYLLARRSDPSGDVYAMVYAMADKKSAAVDLEVVETRPMDTGEVHVADASALQRDIDTLGKAAVYGIYFDTGLAVVKPESRAALDQMAAMLSHDAQLKVYIVGHTDNQGSLAANKDLSLKRANAVMAVLVSQYHIAASRLQAEGVASLSPVSTNTSDKGRALNRRVEMVAQ